MRIGIDIGSTTIKCVVLDDQGKLIHNEDKRDSFSCDIADYEALWADLLTMLS